MTQLILKNTNTIITKQIGNVTVALDTSIIEQHQYQNYYDMGFEEAFDVIEIETPDTDE